MSMLANGFMPSGFGINPNTLNDFSRTQFQPGNYSTSSSCAKLFLYSPHYLPVQVARPFVYQFTPEFIDNVNSQTTCEYAVGRSGPNTTAIKSAILPDDAGMVMDTTNLQNMWSFVLIIDSNPEFTGTITTPGIRHVAMGYVAGEPISDGGAINPAAVLMFTHSTVLFVKKTAGPLTPMDGLSVYNSQDVDYANESVNMMYNDKILLGTPRELMSYANKAMGATMVDYSDIDLTNVKSNAGSRMIGNDIKSPRHQLSAIMQSIDNGIDHTVTQAPVMSRYTDTEDMMGSPLERAINNSAMTMPSAAPLNICTGLDTSTPISMMTLSQKFPDLSVFPYRVRQDANYGWDATQQASYDSSGKLAPIISARNQFSFMAGTVVQACCSQLGISDVAFSYMCLSGDGFTPGKREGFQLQKFNLTVPRVAPIVEEIAKRFKFFLDDQLFDIIFSLMGEFELHCMADMGGNILIDLKLYNYPDPQDGTFFQTSARIGGMINPMLGSVGVINNNVTQLMGATQALCGRELDKQGLSDISMFGEPTSMMPGYN